tara:strand:- start:296 stop:1558 length:1263 start_codon:yes stop_codon:yes gene_type:complete
MILDDWQKEVLETEGNLVLCSGRQVGKSTVIAIKAGESAVKSKKTIMVIAHVERQALLLFEKILSHIYENYKNQIMKGRKKPTKHTIHLKNGSIIHCLPTGDSGYGIRGYTINELYADEAHFIKEDVWAAVTPMLATTGGTINLLSTPFGTTGYFYRCFTDKNNFTKIHVSTEAVAEKRQEPQKTHLVEFLNDEKDRMTKLQYQQEYLGLFVGGIQRFFSDAMITNSCTQKVEPYIPVGDRFQGIDVARMGGDETVLVSLDRIDRDRLIQFDMEIPDGQLLTDTTRLILHKDKLINHKKIYIDDGGMGVGVYDPLLEHEQTKRKVVAINNAKRSQDKITSNQRVKALLKEDLYNNLRVLMESGKIKLFDLPEIKQSLRSIQYEIEGGKLRIYGNYTHITEAIIRAAWCIKDKSLNIYYYS